MARVAKFVVGVAAVACVSGAVAAYAAPRLGGEENRSSPRPAIAGNAIVQTEYVPVAPCRAVDTRKATAGALQVGSTRNFVVAGTSGFTAQGGTNGGCGIPVGASAVTASLTATSITGTGVLYSRPAGSSGAFTGIVNYNKTAGSTSVGQTLPIRVGSGAGLSVRALGARTHFVVDVTGYYREPIAGIVNAEGAGVSLSNQVVSTTRNATGSYTVTFNHSVANCVFQGTAITSQFSVGGTTSGSAANYFVRDVTQSGSPYGNSAVAFQIIC